MSHLESFGSLPTQTGPELTCSKLCYLSWTRALLQSFWTELGWKRFFSILITELHRHELQSTGGHGPYFVKKLIWRNKTDAQKQETKASVQSQFHLWFQSSRSPQPSKDQLMRFYEIQDSILLSTFFSASRIQFSPRDNFTLRVKDFPRDIQQGLETFLVVTTQASGCPWHLVGRGQGC